MILRHAKSAMIIDGAGGLETSTLRMLRLRSEMIAHLETVHVLLRPCAARPFSARRETSRFKVSGYGPNY
jgi:hypothetical protein